MTRKQKLIAQPKCSEVGTLQTLQKAPRRTLGAAWVNDLEGCWYGCYTWHKSLTQVPGPVVVTMEMDKPEVTLFTAATSGVESAYLHELALKGRGHDDKGEFRITGRAVEVGLNC